MNPIAASVLLLFLSPVLIVAVHMAAARLLKGRPNQIVAVIAILASLVPALAIVWFTGFSRMAGSPAEIAAAWIHFTLAYVCIGYSYFHVFNMSETARRIRILHEFYKAGTLTREQILPLYDAKSVIGVRIGRLSDTGQLAEANGRYRLNGKLLYHAALLIQLWRALLGFEPFDKITLDRPQ